MANHYQNGGGRNVAVPEENRPSWRPQDQSGSASMRNRGNDDDHDYRSWRDRNDRDDDRQFSDRDPRRWEGSRGSELGTFEDRDVRRSTERYGQGQSGYSAGRYGDDRAQQGQMMNRNELNWSGYEERGRDFGTDDRFSRGSESDRHAGRGIDRGNDRYDRYDQRMGGGGDRDPRGYDPRGYDPRGYDQRMGYQGGRVRGTEEVGYQGGFGRGSQDLSYRGPENGYQGSAYGRGQDMTFRGGSSQGYGRDLDARSERNEHVHRGTGPHRGKGPMGYQRSDERVRELVSEALSDDDQIDASQIHVAVKDGEVTLTGVVDSRRAKREAEDCVQSVPGVRDVQIQLRVRDDRSTDASRGQAGGGQAGGSIPSQAGSTSTASTPGQSSAGTANSSLGKHDDNQDKKHRA